VWITPLNIIVWGTPLREARQWSTPTSLCGARQWLVRWFGWLVGWLVGWLAGGMDALGSSWVGQLVARLLA